MKDVDVHSDEIIFALLKLVRADHNEVGGGERPSEVRDEKCGKSNVKRKEWLHTVGYSCSKNHPNVWSFWKA